MGTQNSFNARDVLNVNGRRYTYYSLANAQAAGLAGIDRLPYALKVLLENNLRHEDGETVGRASIEAFAGWAEEGHNPAEINFFPTRIMMHDVSGIPMLADLAAMREHMENTSGNGDLVNPVRPVDFIMDHSVTTDVAGRADALARNMKIEFQRNAERYGVAKWSQYAFGNFRLLPPGQGICHQINLETLSKVIWAEDTGTDGLCAFPDSLLAGDSHTPMVNALSVLGWGVGAIEALAAMLGEPTTMAIPDVVGVRLVGKVPEGSTTTDLVLAITQTLRSHGVVQKFVEYFGPGLDHLSLPERATIANMCPEYGASVGFFPTDEETLRYLRLTAREDCVPLVETYCRAQGLWRDDSVFRQYSDILEIDLGTVEACLAGPKLPQSKVALSEAHLSARKAIVNDCDKRTGSPIQQPRNTLQDGDIVIAAITSCTNTSNPSVMLAAGLLAKNARQRGLKSRPWVKTSLSPGSRIVADYLKSAGLLEPLEELGFHVTGFGCMTCCGGSGALSDEVATAIAEKDLNVAAVLSGNRNFEGRIHPQIKLAYLASPPLVIAYALTGSMLHDITREPIGSDSEGQPVYLKDVWPSAREVGDLMAQHIDKEMFAKRYADMSQSSAEWDEIETKKTPVYTWPEASTYIIKPPFLETAIRQKPMRNTEGAAILAILGDSVTTDHISPGSRITENSLAGDYLASLGVSPDAYSSYLQRRVNHEVMMRGTFNNPHIQNEMTPDKRGGWTVHQPSGDVMTIFDAHKRYREDDRALVVVAGRDYGTGSSRDWAAKGAHLLGVRAILAESFERIHRCNLVGMGVLPLQFANGETRISLGLDGTETVDILGLDGSIGPQDNVVVRFNHAQRGPVEISVVCRLDTAREIAWYEAGGIMPYVLDRFSEAA